MVSVTTYETYKEDACLLDAGDHPRITHKSCAFYSETRMTTLAMLHALRDRGLLSLQPPFAKPVLARIRDGVSLSKQIKAKYIEILLEQGAIE